MVAQKALLAAAFCCTQYTDRLSPRTFHQIPSKLIFPVSHRDNDCLNSARFDTSRV
jgi:hypothetical protein